MNWTGGRLQRHSTANRNAVARQKQHFAKAQQNLRKGPKKKPPIKLSIFNHVVEDRERYRRGTSAIDSTASRHRQRSHSGHGSLLPMTDVIQRFDTNLSSKIREQKYSPVPVARQAWGVPDDDLYNATPPPRSAPLERETSVALPEMEFEAYGMEEESMSEKRQRLLRKGDWVGVSIQKPVGIKFAASAIDENIGKRRKIKDGHRARYQPKQARIVSPFAHKRRRQISSVNKELHHTEPRADVRISIGGKVVPPGVSSSSMGRSRSRSVAVCQRSYRGSSEVMLLDKADQAEIKTNRKHHNKLTTRSPSDLQTNHTGRPHTPFYQRKTDRPGQRPSAPSIPEPISSSTHESKISIRSGEFAQPIPQRSKVSALLSSCSSDVVGSTVAHVGIRKPVVPSSQLLENEIWATWVAPASDDGEMLFHEAVKDDHEDTRRVSISPGVNTAFAVWQAAEDPSDNAQSSELESPDVEEPSQHFGSEVVDARITVGLDGYDQDGEEFADEVSFRENLEIFQEDMPSTKSGSPFYPFRSITAIGTKATAKREVEVDEDKKWRKFVFGGSSDGMIEDKFKLDSVVSTVSSRVSLGNSSIMANTGTERSIESPSNGRANQSGTITSRETSDISDTIPRVIHSISLKSKHRRHPVCFDIEKDDRTSLYGANSFVTENESLSPLASLVVQAESVLSNTPKQHEESLPSSSQRGVILTRPKSFVGRKASEILGDQKPVQIGRVLIGRPAKGSKRTRRKERDVYSIPSSDNVEDHVESTNDD